MNFFFSTNFSYNFCFRLDDFNKPLVIQGFCGVFLLTEVVLRWKARPYIPERTFKKWLYASLGLDNEYRFPQSTLDKISLNFWIESAFIALFLNVAFLSLESNLCFIEIVKIGKWSEMSVFKIPVTLGFSALCLWPCWYSKVVITRYCVSFPEAANRTHSTK